MARHLASRLLSPLKLVNLGVGSVMVGSGKEMAPGEVAARLRVSPKTVQRWEKTGELVPVQVLPSGYRRYDPADVERLGAVLAMPSGDERKAAMLALRTENLARAGRTPTE